MTMQPSISAEFNYREQQAEPLGRLLTSPANTLREAVVKTLKTLDTIELTIARMEAAGVTDASPYWRNGRYLYLIHRTSMGERKREYVGANDEKINDALRRVERFKKVQQYKTEFTDYYLRSRQAAKLLDDALKLLTPPEGW